MVEPRSREGDGPSGLRVERVDLVPTELGVVLVRVAGRWEGEPAPGTPVLWAGDQPFDMLQETSGAAERAASGTDVFRATFSVPAEMRPALGIGARLTVGDVEVDLPPPRDTETGEVEPARRNVIDHATLAERRARRAEMAEEASAERAEEAERTLAELEGDLAKLELRLDQANDERAALAARLADATRDARAATQRAEAERRRREESVAELAEGRDEAEGEAARLRARAGETTERARELEREAEDLRRRVAEAEQTAAAAATARARAEEALASAESETAEALASTETEAKEAVARVESAAEEAVSRAQTSAQEAVSQAEASAEEAVSRAEASAEDAVSRAEAGAAEAVARAEAEAEALVAAERAAAGRRRSEILATERTLAQSARAAEPPALPGPAVFDPVGLGQLLGAEARAVRARREPGDTRALRDEARHAAAAVADASWTIAEARDAVGGASDAVEAERALRLAAEREREAVERELAGQRGLTARAESQAAGLRDEIQRRTQVQERAERAIAELRAQVEQLRGLAARAARADEAEAALREYSSAAGEALEEAERRIGEARDAAAAMQDRLDDERDERERAERALREDLAGHVEAATAQVREDLEARILTLAGELQAEREARAAAESALAERPPTASTAPPPEEASAQPAPEPAPEEAEPEEALAPELAPQEAEPEEALAPEPAPEEAPAAGAVPVQAAAAAREEAPPAEAVPHQTVREEPAAEEVAAAPTPVRKPAPRPAPWLRAALRRLAVADPWAAVRLGLQLLPAQALAIERSVDYDLHAAGLGWQAVALRPGTGTVVSVPEQRARGQADFRLSVDAPALAELLAGGGSRDVLRAGNAQVRGTLRRRRALRAIPAANLDLADLAEAGVWPDPGLTLGALALFVDPSWTEGDEFVVALEVVGPRGGRWGVSSPGGRPVTIAPGRPHEPTATVRMPQTALHRLLAGQPGAAEGKAAIRGDVGAVSRLVEWIERAQRETT